MPDGRINNSRPRSTVPSGAEPAASIIAAIGGTRAMAEALGIGDSTVCMWKKSGKIPHWHHAPIIQAFRKKGVAVPLRQLFPDTPKKKPKPKTRKKAKSVARATAGKEG